MVDYIYLHAWPSGHQGLVLSARPAVLKYRCIKSFWLLVHPCVPNTKQKWNRLGSGNKLYKRSVWVAQTLSLGRLTVGISELKNATNMILPLLLSVSLWSPLAGVYTLLLEQGNVFKQSNTFKPSEFQALNIKLDYGYSPEPQRVSRKEKIALKLTQITKSITENSQVPWQK